MCISLLSYWYITGTIRVNFTALAGSISSVQKDTLALATSGHDFTIKPDTVLMGEGVKSVVISVNILEVCAVCCRMTLGV